MSTLFFMAFLGGAAGLLGWAILEPFAPKTLSIVDERSWAVWQLFYAGIIGGLIGTAIGGTSGYLQGSRKHFLRGSIGGCLLGALGGLIGLNLGGAIAIGLFGPNAFGDPKAALLGQETNFFKVVIARTIAFGCFGALLGTGLGFSNMSFKRAQNGFIGGLLGGAIGGAIFDTIGAAIGPVILAARGEFYGEVGQVSRAISSVTIGVAIGLFVGIVERLSRKAWVRLELGRNEGKEWSVDLPQTFIGRSENAHIPLFGDQNIAPMHACIVKSEGEFKLIDGGTPMGIGINGIRVPEAVLNHGDIINIGGFNLRFLLKNARSYASSPIPADASRQTSPVAMGIDPQGMSPQNVPIFPQQAQTAPVERVLRALDGPMQGQIIHLPQGELVAGRECPDLNLSFDTSASRRHAVFVTSPSAVLVRDLGSTNGTIVNGARVQEMTLRPGDTVKIGQTTFRLE